MQYWKPFVNVFWDYVNHPEAKFDGDIGVLKRKHVVVGSVVHIGKESNNLEQAGVLGVQGDDYDLQELGRAAPAAQGKDTDSRAKGR